MQIQTLGPYCTFDWPIMSILNPCGQKVEHPVQRRKERDRKSSKNHKVGRETGKPNSELTYSTSET